MTILTTVNLIETALWPQGDARDPLGIWGARLILPGDASVGLIQVSVQVPAARRRAYVYTAYSAQSVVTVNIGLDTAETIKIRLLTNWPDIDPVNVGVQGYGSFQTSDIRDPTGGFAAPGRGPAQPLINPQDRFILLFDPGVVSSGSPMVIMELERDANVDTVTYAFEAWGYYWDRGVLNAPGGPRHPGSS